MIYIEDLEFDKKLTDKEELELKIYLSYAPSKALVKLFNHLHLNGCTFTDLIVISFFSKYNKNKQEYYDYTITGSLTLEEAIERATKESKKNILMKILN